ncbi:MAG TPA: zinc ribbon domain-containing protein [Thermoplasmata archaeon]|nr:zinc ribbon domain-containing protein [Thermoplasmata archaeon]
MSTKDETRFIDGDMGVTFLYTSGVGGEAFCKGLKDGRLIGSKCPRCAFVYVPSRSFCEECFIPLDNSLEVGPDGELFSYTKVDGHWVGAIMLKGASSVMVHRLSSRRREPQIGDAVRAVFLPKNKRRGSISDIEFFEVRG